MSGSWIITNGLRDEGVDGRGVGDEMSLRSSVNDSGGLVAGYMINANNKSWC